LHPLGRCHENGWGCTRSPTQAAEWYRRSAEAGYFRGQFNYALVLIERGERAAGSEWLCRAATMGDSLMREAVDAVLRGSQFARPNSTPAVIGPP